MVWKMVSLLLSYFPVVLGYALHIRILNKGKF